jgi:hypothetical protein
MSTAITKIEEKIETTKRKLQELGAMRPGKISRQYRNPKEKKKPFYQISYTYQMKSRSEYLRPVHLAAIKQETANFRRFKKLIDRWVALALKASQLRMRQASECPARAS